MKNFLKNNRTTALLLAVVAVLLVFSGVRTSRAALTYISDNYTASVDMPELSIAVVENGQVSSGTLMSDFLSRAGDDEFKAGKVYSEAIAIQNTGNMDGFVRVVISKYWQNADGTRNTDLDPELITLTFGEGWIEDTSLSTPERTVLYYTAKVASGETTVPAITAVTVDGSIMDCCTTTKTEIESGYYVIDTVFDYNGVMMMLNAEACAVQTHNAEDAIKSAWGADVSISNGSLSLK